MTIGTRPLTIGDSFFKNTSNYKCIKDPSNLLDLNKVGCIKTNQDLSQILVKADPNTKGSDFRLDPSTSKTIPCILIFDEQTNTYTLERTDLVGVKEYIREKSPSPKRKSPSRCSSSVESIHGKSRAKSNLPRENTKEDSCEPEKINGGVNRSFSSSPQLKKDKTNGIKSSIKAADSDDGCNRHDSERKKLKKEVILTKQVSHHPSSAQSLPTLSSTSVKYKSSSIKNKSKTIRPQRPEDKQENNKMDQNLDSVLSTDELDRILAEDTIDLPSTSVTSAASGFVKKGLTSSPIQDDVPIENRKDNKEQEEDENDIFGLDEALEEVLGEAEDQQDKSPSEEDHDIFGGVIFPSEGSPPRASAHSRSLSIQGVSGYKRSPRAGNPLGLQLDVFNESLTDLNQPNTADTINSVLSSKSTGPISLSAREDGILSDSGSGSESSSE